MCCNQFAQTPLPGIIMKLKIVYHSLELQRLEKHKLRKFAQLICKLQQAAVHH
jgi:hypothetical protein